MLKGKIKAVVFDVDDVIIRNRDENGRYFWSKNIENDIGINEEIMRGSLFKDKQLWEEIMRGKRKIEEVIDLFLMEYKFSVTTEEFLNYLLEHDAKVDDRVLLIVKKLRNIGYKTFLATHQEKIRRAYIWNNLGFKDYFDDIFTPEYVNGFIKKEKEFFNILQNRIGFASEELVMIDDKVENIECAKSCGWYGYQYYDYNKAVEELFCKLI
jgi:putative hydrolase of the HAD superfamily